jgi:prevent-host-death family protein
MVRGKIDNSKEARIMYQVDIIEAKEKLLELIEVAMRGEEVAITQDNQPVVKVVGIPKQAKPNRQAGSAKRMVWMSDDFDEPLEEFKEYRS